MLRLVGFPLALCWLLLPGAVAAAEITPIAPPAGGNGAETLPAQVQTAAIDQSRTPSDSTAPVTKLPTPPAPSPAATPVTTAAAAPPRPDKPDDAQPAVLNVPAAGRTLAAGEMLIVSPGQNLVVESPAEPERLTPLLDAQTGEIAWVRLPGRAKQVVAIRWLDTSNIKKLVEIEMLQGDLFLAVSPRGQSDRSIAIRGRKRGLAVEAPDGWRPIQHRPLKLHCEVDASLRLVGYGDSLLPGDPADPAQAIGLHIFASLRPGALVQNAGATTLVVEQYDQSAPGSDRLRWTDGPNRVLLPPETSLTTNGGQFDLRHFYIPEPGQPAGPERLTHVYTDMPALQRALTLTGADAAEPTGNGRAAEAAPGVLP